jgi:hypothetical protein
VGHACIHAKPCCHPPAWLLLLLARTVSAAFSSSTPWLHHCKHIVITHSMQCQLAQQSKTIHTSTALQSTCGAPCGMCCLDQRASALAQCWLPLWLDTRIIAAPCNTLQPEGMQAHLLQAAMLGHRCSHILHQLLVDVAQAWRHPDACSARHSTAQHAKAGFSAAQTERHASTHQSMPRDLGCAGLRHDCSMFAPNGTHTASQQLSCAKALCACVAQACTHCVNIVYQHCFSINQGAHTQAYLEVH